MFIYLVKSLLSHSMFNMITIFKIISPFPPDGITYIYNPPVM